MATAPLVTIGSVGRTAAEASTSGEQDASAVQQFCAGGGTCDDLPDDVGTDQDDCNRWLGPARLPALCVTCPAFTQCSDVPT